MSGQVKLRVQLLVLIMNFVAIGTRILCRRSFPRSVR